ncbi:MAG: hypothetical protein KKD35_03695 [Elusimicrobia bacterium]|nr:hypothetical protein [Elusimicrobiota bacterium]
MQTLPENYTILKTFQDFPFSQVKLVSIKNKKYILKSVPTFFDFEFKRQIILYKKCKKTTIPKIYLLDKTKGRTNCLMEYFPKDKKVISEKKYIETISIFHQETKNFKNKNFPIYNEQQLLTQFKTIKKWIPVEMAGLTSKELKKIFYNIFNSEYSILHGDWCNAQLISSKGNLALLDFGLSLYGPSILDHAHYFRNKKTINKNILKQINISRDDFLIAILLESLRYLGWIDWFIKNKFSTYKFENEINKTYNIIKFINKKLKI